MFGFFQSLIQGASSIVTQIHDRIMGGGGTPPVPKPTAGQFANANQSATNMTSATNQATACLVCQASAASAPPAHTLGSLSARYESGGNPAAVSTGIGDPGGISYGAYQYATNTGDAALFVASPEFQPWAADFAGLTPGTTAFNDQWRATAASDPAGFAEAQHNYMGRSHYDPVVTRVSNATGFNLDTASDAVRDATWSLSVQHGRASTILSDAVNRTDAQLGRADPEYDRTLINNIYDRRTEYVEDLRAAAVREGRTNDARTFQNIIDNRYPQERQDALDMLPAVQPQMSVDPSTSAPSPPAPIIWNGQG